MAELSIVTEVDGDYQVCWVEANRITSDTHRELMPVRVFHQGPRTMVSGVLPVRVLLRVLMRSAASKGSSPASITSHVNRPVDAKHVRDIAEYIYNAIREDKPYLLPPLTLNATGELRVFVPKGMRGPVTGWAILPEEQLLNITDGQHRFLALEKVYQASRGTAEVNRFLNDGIPVMITLSSSIEEVHQDFADASKTKRLPPSLVAVYDLRHPGNRAVLQLIGKTRLFEDRVDSTSATLSINSPFIFLVNQVRQFVKGSLTGNHSISDDAFYKQANDALSDQHAFDQWVASRVSYIEALTDMIPEWKEIAALPKPQGPEGPFVLHRMKEIRRRQSVALTAAALSALGMVSHEVILPLMKGSRAPEHAALEFKLAPLSQVDWSREADLWQDNIVQDGTIRTQVTAVRTAVRKLLAIIHGGGVSN